MEILLKNRVPFFSIPFFFGCIMTNKAGLSCFYDSPRMFYTGSVF